MYYNSLTVNEWFMITIGRLCVWYYLYSALNMESFHLQSWLNYLIRWLSANDWLSSIGKFLAETDRILVTTSKMSMMVLLHKNWSHFFIRPSNRVLSLNSSMRNKFTHFLLFIIFMIWWFIVESIRTTCKKMSRPTSVRLIKKNSLHLENTQNESQVWLSPLFIQRPFKNS